MHCMMSRPAAATFALSLGLGVCLLGCPQDDGPAVAGADGDNASARVQPDEEPSVDDSAEDVSATADEAGAEADGAVADSDGEPADGETGDATPPEPGTLGPAEPDGYGEFTFTADPPSEDQLTLHGLAGYEVVAIYAEPSKESTKLGFLRIGARMRVGPAVKNDECVRGWHQLETGGYACASRGLVVDSKRPYASHDPKPPRMDSPFPYDWAYVRKWNTPMWWRAPTPEEYRATLERQAILESERTGEPLPGEEPPAGDGGGDGAGEDGVDEPGSEAGTPAVDDGGDDGGADDSDVTPPEPAEPEEPEEPVKLPLSPSHPWLEKGYFVSLGDELRENGRGYWRTARGGVVEKANAYTYEPKDYAGALLTEDMSFPVGFVMAKNGTKLVELGDDDQLHATGKTLDKRTFLDLGEEVEINGRTYFTVQPLPPGEGEGEGDAPGPDSNGEAETGTEVDLGPQLLVKADVIRTPDLQPMPQGLEPWDRWIDVDITKQMLVAYEGPRPVYVTLVSTGKKGTNEEPFETPVGRYRIYSKQVTSNMDGTTATDGNYAIQDVPWVMYFEGSYALHGAFWHRSFGYVRSHGCVNLGPTDARWLFMWTTPFLPEGWHGVKTSDDNPGTTVVIRKSE